MKNTKASDIAFLATLENVVRQRMERRQAGSSYVASLVSQGERRIAQKLGEEAVETVLAASSGTRSELIEEAADLIFHLLVLLQAKEIDLAEVVQALEQRHADRAD